MTAAVTGASGHIGNNLCRALLEKGIHVKALVRNDRTALKDIDIQFVEGDINDRDSLETLVKDTDIVFHLAAIISIDSKSKNLLKNINVNGTKILTNLCLKNNIKRFIHFSSIHALNQYPLDKELTEKNALVENEGYAYDRSKSAAEKVVLEACKKGLDAVILNPTSVIGINDYKPSLIGQAFLKIANGKLPALIPGGFDWVDVQDVVQGTIAAIDKGRKGERYLLSGNWYSIEDLATEIGNHSNRKNPIKVSTKIAIIGLPFLTFYSKITKTQPLYTSESLNILATSNKNVSCKKAEVELGYSIRPFSETILDTFKWFENNNLIMN